MRPPLNSRSARGRPAEPLSALGKTMLKCALDTLRSPEALKRACASLSTDPISPSLSVILCGFIGVAEHYPKLLYRAPSLWDALHALARRLIACEATLPWSAVSPEHMLSDLAVVLARVGDPALQPTGEARIGLRTLLDDLADLLIVTFLHDTLPSYAAASAAEDADRLIFAAVIEPNLRDEESEHLEETQADETVIMTWGQQQMLVIAATSWYGRHPEITPSGFRHLDLASYFFALCGSDGWHRSVRTAVEHSATARVGLVAAVERNATQLLAASVAFQGLDTLHDAMFHATSEDEGNELIEDTAAFQLTLTGMATCVHALASVPDPAAIGLDASWFSAHALPMASRLVKGGHAAARVLVAATLSASVGFSDDAVRHLIDAGLFEILVQAYVAVSRLHVPLPCSIASIADLALQLERRPSLWADIRARLAPLLPALVDRLPLNESEHFNPEPDPCIALSGLARALGLGELRRGSDQCAAPGCSRFGATSQCAGCLFVCYCGHTCHRAAWRSHKASCRLLASYAAA